MAEILFAGGGLDSVTTTGTASEYTGGGRSDPSYTNNALAIFNITGNFVATGIDATGTPKSVTTGKTFFGHCEAYHDGVQTVMNILSACDAAGNEWVGVRCKSSGVYGLFYNSNTSGSPTWVQIGSDFTFGGSLQTFDLRVFIDAAGTAHQAEFLLGNASKASGTFSNANLTALQKLKGTGSNIGGATTYYSQILITEGISTVGAKVDYNGATGAGTTSGWSGAYTDINEASLNDGTVISAASAALKSTFAYGDVTVPAGYTIKSVFLFTRGKNDGSGDIKPVCRSGGTDFSGSNLVGIGVGYNPLGYRYDTDPNTSAAWTQTNFNAAEFGALSA